MNFETKKGTHGAMGRALISLRDWHWRPFWIRLHHSENRCIRCPETCNETTWATGWLFCFLFTTRPASSTHMVLVVGLLPRFTGPCHQSSGTLLFSKRRKRACGKPVAPSGRDTTIDKGDQGRLCPQALATWEIYSPSVTASFLSGIVPNLTQIQKQAITDPSDLGVPIDPRETEDCLLLDVVTPVQTFEKEKSDSNLAPVIVWFYGGGYTTGDKSGFAPSGLIDASYTASENGLVFVSVNSRVSFPPLGLFAIWK